MKIFYFVIILGMFSMLGLKAQNNQSRGAVPIKIRDNQGQDIKLYEGSYALLIGVSDYTAGWPDLESIPGELAGVKTSLEANGFTVETVLNPDGKALKAAFSNFIDKYGYAKQNRLLFYYSGHGHSREDGKKGYLVPADAPIPDKDLTDFLRKSLSMSQILSWSRQIEAKHVLYLFDSCFSGTIFKTRALMKTPPLISAATAKPVRQFITAGSAGEVVPARSVFTPSFERAIKGEADLNKDGYITGAELGLYLKEKVLYYGTGQTPQYGKIRDPDLDEGDFVILNPTVATAANQQATATPTTTGGGTRSASSTTQTGSTSSISLSPSAHEVSLAKLQRLPLTIDNLKAALADFKLDGTAVVSRDEAVEMLKYIGAENIQAGLDFALGEFKTGYQVGLWVGSYDDIKDCYSFRFNKPEPGEDFYADNRTFFEVCKKEGSDKVSFDLGAMIKYPDIRESFQESDNNEQKSLDELDPRIARLHTEPLTIDNLKAALADYQLDGTATTSQIEAANILQHLGASNIGGDDATVSGDFPTGYVLIIWLETYDEVKTCYSLRFAKPDTDGTFEPSNKTFFEICKQPGSSKIEFDKVAVQKYPDIRNW